MHWGSKGHATWQQEPLKLERRLSATCCGTLVTLVSPSVHTVCEESHCEKEGRRREGEKEGRREGRKQGRSARGVVHRCVSRAAHSHLMGAQLGSAVCVHIDRAQLGRSIHITCGRCAQKNCASQTLGQDGASREDRVQPSQKNPREC